MKDEKNADSQLEEGTLEGDSGEEKAEDLKDVLKKVISVTVEDAGILRRKMTITVPPESIRSELDKEFKELIHEAVVPGFRRGRAPRRLIEKRFGQEVGSQVQTRIVSNAYLAAVEKEDLKVLGDPLVIARPKGGIESEHSGQEQLMDMPTALPLLKLPDEGSFEFRCEVEVKPEFELPPLEGVPVERPKLKITDQDVVAQVNRIRGRHGAWAPVGENGKVEAGDLLVCDIKISVGGEEVKTLDNKQLAARPQMIEGVIFPKFGDDVAGAAVGETRALEGELPDDYAVESLRGKKAQFELKIHEIKRLQLPPIDEAYLSALGFDSETEYREFIRTRMEAELDQEIRRGMREQVRKYLLDNVKMELPERLSSRQTERAVTRRTIELQRQGVAEMEIEQHADELRTGAEAQAVAELKSHFIMEEIAEKLEVSVTEEEINDQIAGMARAYNKRFDRVRDALARNNGIESLYLELRDEKCIDTILESAKIIEKTVDQATDETKPKAAKKKKTTPKATASVEKPGDAAEEIAEKPAKKKTTKKKA